MPNPSGTASVDPRSRADRPTWVDLLNPTQDEAAEVAAEYRVQVPSRESLQEVESSSRARAEGQVTLYVNMPLVIQDASAGFAPLPLGFILSPELLVTVRYPDVHAFAESQGTGGKRPAHEQRSGVRRLDRRHGRLRCRYARDLGRRAWLPCQQAPSAKTPHRWFATNA